MKLIFCTKCLDVVRLKQGPGERYCECGECFGRYTDDVNAYYGGPAIPLGFHNVEFIHALRNQPEKGMGKEFKAFVIPKECATMENKNA